MKTLKMKFRKAAAITLTAAMMIGMFPMTASAQEEVLLQDSDISEEQLINEVLVEETDEAKEPIISEQEEIQALTDDLADPEVLTEQDIPVAEQAFDEAADGAVPEGDANVVASVTTKGGTATNYTDFNSAVGAWNSAGAGATLKLLENVESMATVSVNGGIEGSPMILDLNDHGILYTGNSGEIACVIRVNSDSYFELTDSNSEQTKKYITKSKNGRGTSVSTIDQGGSSLEITGGYIAGGMMNLDMVGVTRGGGILNEGTTTMNRGNICANLVYGSGTFGGAGVYNTGSFLMKGGKITANFILPVLSLVQGAGVYNGGTFIMYDGDISGNTKSKADDYMGGDLCGGGVDNLGTFVMKGGTISGNSARDGGGVQNCGEFILRGGKIYDNRTTSELSGGSGVYNFGGTFLMRGGEIFDNITEKLGGGVLNGNGGSFTISRGKIYGNTATESGNAVYRESGELEFKGTIQAGVAKDGTDKATVSANEAASHINEYGYVEVTGGHDFTYTANGATITAVCADEDCTLPNKTASITINAPDDLIYDGTQKKVNVTGDTEVIEKPDIKYYAEDGKETDNVIKAGTYTAKMTMEDVTASITYTIEKAEVLLTTPEPIDVTYSGTEKNLVNAGYTPDGTIYYAVMKTNTLPDDSKYSTAVPKAKDIGSYYVWYKVKADENHINMAPKCVKAMINGKYTVTFDLNGKGGEAPAAQSVEKNGKAKKPADPTADGFKFAGWFTDKNCTMGYNFDALVISDITLYAKWVKAETNTVKVVFNMQGHGIQIPEQIIESGKKPIQPDDPIDSTKVFGGWYTEPECKTLFDFKKAVTADTNIYAKWSDKEVTGLTAYFADEDLKYNAGLGRYEIVYTGGKIQPSVVVTNNATGDKELTLGTDYTISYTNNLNVDKNGKPAVVTVKGTGNYSGSKKLLFYILPKSLGSGADATPAADITLSNILVQSGSKVSPVICYRGYKLANKDFTVTSKTGNLKFTDADAAENRKVTITGKGNFSGCIKDAPVTVLSKKDLADKTIKVTLGKNISLIYNGKPQVLKEGTQLKVMAGEKSLSENYIVSYTDNINAGTAKVTVTGVNGYTGSVTKSFKIAPDKNTSTVTAQAPAKTAYDVNGAKPKVNVSTVRDGVKVMLAEGVDYTVTYSSNKKVTGKTKAKYTVKFMGNYKGRKNMTGTFEIEPAAFNADVKAVNLYYTKPGKYMSAPYVSIGGVLLTKKDYTVKYYVGGTDITDKSYTLSGDAASVKVVVTGKGNYKADAVTVESCYTIRKAPENAIDLTQVRVVSKGTTKSIPAQQYTGMPIVPEFDILVKIGNEWKNISETGLIKDTDYEVIILNNVNKGNATILINAKGSSNKAAGSKALKFKISQKKLTGAGQMLR